MLAAICICVLDWSRCRAKEAICMRIILCSCKIIIMQTGLWCSALFSGQALYDREAYTHASVFMI